LDGVADAGPEGPVVAGPIATYTWLEYAIGIAWIHQFPRNLFANSRTSSFSSLNFSVLNGRPRYRAVRFRGVQIGRKLGTFCIAAAHRAGRSDHGRS